VGVGGGVAGTSTQWQCLPSPGYQGRESGETDAQSFIGGEGGGGGRNEREVRKVPERDFREHFGLGTPEKNQRKNTRIRTCGSEEKKKYTRNNRGPGEGGEDRCQAESGARSKSQTLKK